MFGMKKKKKSVGQVKDEHSSSIENVLIEWKVFEGDWDKHSAEFFARIAGISRPLKEIDPASQKRSRPYKIDPAL